MPKVFTLPAALLGFFLIVGLPILATAAPNFTDVAFANTWNRVDKVIVDLPDASRGFIWGPPAPGSTQTYLETYNGGQRKVQYFDKARMEINNPTGNPNDLFYVTTGLLVKELVTGKRQDGDNQFTQLVPSQVQVAGDSNELGANQVAPTYDSFQEVVTVNGTVNGQPNQVGRTLILQLDRAGKVSQLPGLPESRIIKGYDAVTEHNIPDVFVDFANQSGPVWNGSQIITGPVFFANPFYVLGRPISEAYWTRAEVKGVEQYILVQLFERRVLTYTPANPVGFKVEMGNVGQHYYRWRYVENNRPPTTGPATQPSPIPPVTPPAVTPNYGLNSLLNLYNLPQLGSYGQTYEVSSHDPTGANYDYGNYLYRDSSSNVIFDEMGQGVVSRIWMTNYVNRPFSDIGRIKFYLDNESTPRLDMAIEDFFAGKTAPFLAPLVGNAKVSSGGNFSYVPVNYAQRLKIVTTGTPGYYQINFQKLTVLTKISSFTGQEDYSQTAKILSNPGTDPKPSRPGRQLITGSGTAVQGNELELSGILNGPAVISSLKLKLNITDPNLISKIFLRIQWDGQAKAQVETPLDYFFGSGMNEKRVAGLMVGMDPTTHQYYCYFPMPFHQSARITLFNSSALPIPVQWEIGLEPDPTGQLVNSNSGYFNATFQSQRETPQGQDYNLLKVSGRGRYVGTVINFYGQNSIMEGDERTYVDGSNTSRLYGTGIEDYFNGAYGFANGAFSLPLVGSPYQVSDDASNLNLVAYRFLLSDAISFNSSLEVGFEQGFIGQDKPTPGQDYSSLAFWYGLDESNLLPTDGFSVFDQASVKAHAYSNSGVASNGILSSYFEGYKDQYLFADSGYSLTGGSQFNINIVPDNAGVVLRRRFDYGGINQQANIYVDRQLVGRWFSPGQNQQKRWREEDFNIPGSFTQGKSLISIRVEPVVEPSPWSESLYASFVIKPA